MIRRVLTLLLLLTTTTHLSAAQSLPGGGTLALVPNLGSGDVSIISSVTNSEVARIPVGPFPMLATASPDGQFGYIASDRQSYTGSSTIWKLSFSQLAVVSSLVLQLGDEFFDLVISPNGQLLAATDQRRATVFIIETSNMSVRHSLVLCNSCDGFTLPLNAPTRLSFSPDSNYLTAIVPVAAQTLTIDVQTAQIISTSGTGSPVGDSVPFTDVARFSHLAPYLLSAHPTYGVRIYDIFSSFSLPLPFFAGSYPYDIELSRFAGLHLAFAGSIEYDPNPDYLKLFAFDFWGGIQFPSSESLRWLRYNTLTNELWGTCISWFGGGGICTPFVIDIFSMQNGGARTTITAPTGVVNGLPAFSPDQHYYYQPLPTNEILVINALTKQQVCRIPVGSSPQSVVFQGDSYEKEVTT